LEKAFSSSWPWRADSGLFLYDDHNIKHVNSNSADLKEGVMVRYDQGHRERTRQAIVEAASRLMRDRGFTEASVANVMKAVGLTHGGFYAHFPDKTAMLAAAMEKAFVESPKNFAAMARIADATGDVGVIARHYLADNRVGDVASGCPAAALVSEVHRQDAAVQSAFRKGTEETLLSLAKAPGLSTPEGQHAWAALAMLVGGLSMMRAMPDAGLNDTIRDQIIDALRKLGTSAGAPPAKQDTAE
jgi:TetR/AcrR family transcriptional regulator, transcriptional repressor for nem operon